MRKIRNLFTAMIKMTYDAQIKQALRLTKFIIIEQTEHCAYLPSDKRHLTHL